MEPDPVLVCLLIGGLLVPLLMTVDDALSGGVRRTTLGMFAAYCGVTVLLYLPGVCFLGNQLCGTIMRFRVGLSQWLGRDLASIVLALSGFVSFNVDLSGTTSRRWYNLGIVLTAVFWIAFVTEFFSTELPPMGVFLLAGI